MNKDRNERKDCRRTGLGTWVVTIWLDEEEPDRGYWLNQARHWKNQESGLVGLTHQLADELRNTKERLPYCLHRLLLDTVLCSVDWLQIAEHLFDRLDRDGKPHEVCPQDREAERAEDLVLCHS